MPSSAKKEQSRLDNVIKKILSLSSLLQRELMCSQQTEILFFLKRQLVCKNRNDFTSLNKISTFQGKGVNFRITKTTKNEEHAQLST